MAQTFSITDDTRIFVLSNFIKHRDDRWNATFDQLYSDVFTLGARRFINHLSETRVAVYEHTYYKLKQL
jgi:hypothetical protein